MKPVEKINIGDIRIERLKKEHDLSKFISYEKELVNFLTQDALNNQEKRISVTYLWFLKRFQYIFFISFIF